VVIGEAGYFFAFHSDTMAQQGRNWQARFRMKFAISIAWGKSR
jgi:hypothetical protein